MDFITMMWIAVALALSSGAVYAWGHARGRREMKRRVLLLLSYRGDVTEELVDEVKGL